jgi:hypothetical protein
VHRHFIFLLLVACIINGWCKLAFSQLLPITLKGNYLLYSYDHNYIYGKNQIQISSNFMQIQCDEIHFSVKHNSILCNGRVNAKFGEQSFQSDQLEINLFPLFLVFVNYGQQIQTAEWDLFGLNFFAGLLKIPEFQTKKLIDLEESLIYFVGKHFLIETDHTAIGYQVTVFLESIPSLSFNQFIMNRPAESSGNRLNIDKIWYASSSGLITDLSLNLQKKGERIAYQSKTKVKSNYDLFKTSGKPMVWELLLQSDHSLQINPNQKLNLNFAHITHNMNAIQWEMKRKFSSVFSADFCIDYTAPYKMNQELWLQTNWQAVLKKCGQLGIRLGYEVSGQGRSQLNYWLSPLKNVSFGFDHAYFYGQGNSSEKFRNSSLKWNLGYGNSIFSVSSLYSLNKDLIRQNTQQNPQFNFNIQPFSMYDNLLQVDLFSTVTINQLHMPQNKTTNAHTNLGLGIHSNDLYLFPATSVRFSSRMEQFLDHYQQRHTTSLGMICEFNKKISRFCQASLLYHFQTRRQTSWWLVPGTSSEDVTALIRIEDSNLPINCWFSLSADTKNSEFTSGLFDFQVNLIKNWKFQTLLNYDFFMNQFHYDVNLLRQAGRITLRFTYRSLSRQFLIEIIPGQ